MGSGARAHRNGWPKAKRWQGRVLLATSGLTELGSARGPQSTRDARHAALNDMTDQKWKAHSWRSCTGRHDEQTWN